MRQNYRSHCSIYCEWRNPLLTASAKGPLALPDRKNQARSGAAVHLFGRAIGRAVIEARIRDTNSSHLRRGWNFLLVGGGFGQPWFESGDIILREATESYRRACSSIGVAEMGKDMALMAG